MSVLKQWPAHKQPCNLSVIGRFHYIGLSQNSNNYYVYAKIGMLL